MLVLFRFLERWLGARAAAIAVAGTASVSAWGYPLTAVAGVQDLWMLLFGLLSLAAGRARRPWVAAALFLAALLSKESAVLFLPLSIAIALAVDRLDLRGALRTHGPAMAVGLAWLLFHPTLLTRASGGFPASLETAARPAWWIAALQSALAVGNLEVLPAPEVGWGKALLLAAAGAVPLLTILWVHRAPSQAPPSGTLAVLAGWTVVGCAAAALPSLGWHAYYAILGLIGAWAMLGVLLSRRPGAAIAAIALMAALRAARASTPSPDWGDEWFQVRSGNTLGAVRAALFERHRAFPPHSRVYFTHTRSRGSTISGSPALRTWYDDPTLRSFHLREFSVRGHGEPAGRDYFFYFDASGRPVELEPSRDGRPPETRDAAWEGQHFSLGTALLLGGETAGAASEYLAVARSNPRRSDCALFAAACYRVLGRTAAEAEAMRLALASGMSRQEAEARVERLLADFPPARAPGDPSAPGR